MTIWDFDWTYFWETANYVSWYEYLALIFFGAGWWVSIKNSLQTRQVDGKNFAFLWMVILGACCGIGGCLFVDLNFKIVIYLVVLCGAASDYYVCRRLLLEQKFKERRSLITDKGERDWSYGADLNKASNDKRRRRHHRHREGVHRSKERDSKVERISEEKGAVVSSNIEEIQFDDING